MSPTRTRIWIGCGIVLALVIGLVMGFTLGYVMADLAGNVHRNTPDTDRPSSSSQQQISQGPESAVSGRSSSSWIPTARSPQSTCAAEGNEDACHTYGSYPCGRFDPRPRDCLDIRRLNPSAKTGIYSICTRTNDGHQKSVYCDMGTDGGGWLVFQRRATGCVDFYRGWDAYADGFGELPCEFWLGNRFLHEITTRGPTYSLRVDLEDFDNETRFAEYAQFSVDAEADNFTLHIGSYIGSAGNSLAGHNGRSFSTKDRDNDSHGGSCARMFKGAWWYSSCHSSNLHGRYLKGNHTSYADGVNWSGWRGQRYALKKTELKIRPIIGV